MNSFPAELNIQAAATRLHPHINFVHINFHAAVPHGTMKQQRNLFSLKRALVTIEYRPAQGHGIRVPSRSFGKGKLKIVTTRSRLAPCSTWSFRASVRKTRIRRETGFPSTSLLLLRSAPLIPFFLLACISRSISPHPDEKKKGSDRRGRSPIRETVRCTVVPIFLATLRRFESASNLHNVG